jgi:hypothetical protein
MSWLGYDQGLDQTASTRDRRGDDRTRILKPIRVRRMDAIENEADQPGTLIDFSREGMLLATPSHDFKVGMVLRLIFPESSSECTCEVVRAEKLPNGHMAVGLRILGW